MELKDTVELMISPDWKDRFLAEYLQTKIRYKKLHKLIVKRECGKHGFNTPIPLESWKEQAKHMGLYLNELEKQAVIHGIELPDELNKQNLLKAFADHDYPITYPDGSRGRGMGYGDFEKLINDLG